MRERIFASTGEVSGDLHLSYIAKNIMEQAPNTKIYAVAGEHSSAAGVEIIQDIKEIAVMGFVEGLKKYSFLKERARYYVDFIKKEKIGKVILVDYGGFNLKFLELLKSEAPKVEVFYYIPPKVWIWGESRVKKIKLADHIVVIFPWEVEFYKKHGIDAVYYGNPFVDKYKKIQKRGKDILLLPGSRKQEIELIFPEMYKVIKENPQNDFLLKLSSENHLNWLPPNLEKVVNLKIEFEKSLEQCVEQCQAAIATSGTVTLELALLGIPTVVVYKTSKLNAFIVKNFIKLGYVSLPNLTINEEVFPELLQEKCKAEIISKTLEKVISEKEEIEKKIEQVRTTLSGEEVLRSYAKYILEGRKDEEI